MSATVTQLPYRTCLELTPEELASVQAVALDARDLWLVEIRVREKSVAFWQARPQYERELCTAQENLDHARSRLVHAQAALVTVYRPWPTKAVRR